VNDESPKQQPSGKGRPTPSRKEAEAARKKALKQSGSRKERAARERRARDAARQKQLAALDGTGDPAYLPARDKGAAKAMTRDFIDRRFTVAEFLLPVLILVLALTFFSTPKIQLMVGTVMYAVIVVTAIDTAIVWFSLRRQLAKRFTKVESVGCLSYGILRTTQMRFLRRPKPTVARGEQLKARY
jgi:hypothetical protein